MHYHAASSTEAISNEYIYAAHNYSPLPIVISRAKGSSVWDPEGRHYLDFLSSFSSVNQGHCHSELIKALTDQASRLTLTGRAFHNDVFPQFAKFVTQLFGYEMVLPTSTGAEAVETAVKISRKWGYKVKGIPENEGIVLSATNNFHGRTMTAVSLSSDPSCRNLYGPHLPNTGPFCPATGRSLHYNSISDLRDALEVHGSRVASLILEPIQGEAGTIIPDDDYLKEVRSLCEKHQVLFICDEIQTGIARTGRMLCYEWSGVKPDMVLLGKSLSGGILPVSCVLGSKDVMLTVEPGTHGSTFGGNPLGCAVAIRALELVKEERLIERANEMGDLLRRSIRELRHPLIKAIRGKGLFNVMTINEVTLGKHDLWALCLTLRDKGLITKTVPPNLVRLAPPLVITAAEIASAVDIISSSLTELAGHE